MKIRYSEIFASFQGEGVRAGMPSSWIRFFGCNLNCNGFGQDNIFDESTWELPYKTIPLAAVKSMADVPVITKGCDSGYSWCSRFKHLATTKTVEEVLDELEELNYKAFGASIGHPWESRISKQPIQLCFTGGEPMLQQKAMETIVEEMRSRYDLHAQEHPFTIETNCTQPIKFNESSMYFMHASCSPKLRSVSGESNALLLDRMREYMDYFETGAFKFVVNDTIECWNELDSLLSNLAHHVSDKYPRWSIWAMPVGADIESQDASKIERIVDTALSRGLHIATRNHVYVYGNRNGK